MDQLVFCSKSKNADPGAGIHEKTEDCYDELKKYDNWRKQLSNFDCSVEFMFNNYRYRSVEHAFQGTKISLADKSKGFLFTIDSGHTIGQSDGAIAQKNRKLLKLSPEQITEWNKISCQVMEDATYAKYGHALQNNNHIIKMLLATKNSKLIHLQLQRGKPSKLIHFKHLEDIRTALNNQNELI